MLRESETGLLLGEHKVRLYHKIVERRTKHVRAKTRFAHVVRGLSLSLYYKGASGNALGARTMEGMACLTLMGSVL